MEGPKEEENKKMRLIIKSDCKRTRALVLTQEEVQMMEWVLVCYCAKEEIWYKQGMNEILAPFVIMARDGLNLEEVYSYFSRFVQKVLPSVFRDNVIFK